MFGVLQGSQQMLVLPHGSFSADVGERFGSCAVTVRGNCCLHRNAQTGPRADVSQSKTKLFSSGNQTSLEARFSIRIWCSIGPKCERASHSQVKRRCGDVVS